MLSAAHKFDSNFDGRCHNQSVGRVAMKRALMLAPRNFWINRKYIDFVFFKGARHPFITAFIELEPSI
jgi:hypothetical protein